MCTATAPTPKQYNNEQEVNRSQRITINKNVENKLEIVRNQLYHGQQKIAKTLKSSEGGAVPCRTSAKFIEARARGDSGGRDAQMTMVQGCV